ncbi:hypothetical protein TWF696_008688 [Orbilia brochopaga]|uniref:Uncharacterized protein n=1 Tax=Orbilia brochopaga TaxID=3140254 RepID=A0AAV9UK09_9PEZI
MVGFTGRLPAFISLTLVAKASAYTVFFQAQDSLQSNLQSHDVIDSNACYRVSTTDANPSITGVGVINSRSASPWSYIGRPGHGANGGGAQNIRAIALYAGFSNYDCIGDPTTIIRFSDDVPTGDRAITHFVDLTATDPSLSGVYRFWKPVNPESPDWAPYLSPQNPPGYVGYVQEDGTLDLMYLNVNGDMALQTREYEDHDEAVWMLLHLHDYEEDLLQSTYQQAVDDLDEFDNDAEGWIRKALKTEEGALPPRQQAAEDLQLEEEYLAPNGPNQEDLFADWASAQQNADQQQEATGGRQTSESVGGRGEVDDDLNEVEVEEDLQEEGQSNGDEWGQGINFEIKLEEEGEEEASLWQQDWVSDGMNVKIEEGESINNDDLNNLGFNPFADFDFDSFLTRLLENQPPSNGVSERPQMMTVETQTSPLNNIPASADVGVQTDLVDDSPVQIPRLGRADQRNPPEQPQSLFIPTARRPPQIVTGQRPIPQVIQRLQQSVGPNFMNDNSAAILGYLASLEEPDPFTAASRPVVQARINAMYEPGSPMWQEMVADADAVLEEAQTRERRRRIFQPLMDTDLSQQTARSMVELGLLFDQYQQQGGQLERALSNYDLDLANLQIPDPMAGMNLTPAQMAEMDAQNLIANYLALSGRGPELLAAQQAALGGQNIDPAQLLGQQIAGDQSAYNLLEGNSNPNQVGGTQPSNTQVKIEEQ